MQEFQNPTERKRYAQKRIRNNDSQNKRKRVFIPLPSDSEMEENDMKVRDVNNTIEVISLLNSMCSGVLSSRQMLIIQKDCLMNYWCQETYPLSRLWIPSYSSINRLYILYILRKFVMEEQRGRVKRKRFCIPWMSTCRRRIQHVSISTSGLFTFALFLRIDLEVAL